jgi:hypothetical protein
MSRSTALMASTIAFVALYLGAVLALGTPPGVNDDGATVVQWLVDHQQAVRWSTWLSTLSAPFFATYAVLMRERLARTAGRFFLLGASAVLVLTSLSAWVLAGLARRPDSLDPATARTLLDVSAYWGPTLTGFTVLTLGALAVAGLRHGRLPRWVGMLAAVAFVEQAVETVTVFGRSGFIAAGGPMNTMLGAGLTVVTWLVAGIAAARRPAATDGDAEPAAT